MWGSEHIKSYYDMPYLPQSHSLHEIEQSVLKYGNITTTVQFGSPAFDDAYTKFGPQVIRFDSAVHQITRLNELLGVLFRYTFQYIGNFSYICKVSFA